MLKRRTQGEQRAYRAGVEAGITQIERGLGAREITSRREALQVVQDARQAHEVLAEISKAMASSAMMPLAKEPTPAQIAQAALDATDG